MNITSQSHEVAAGPERNLRRVLRLNAVTSFAAGLAGLTAATWCADVLGVGSPTAVRLVGAGLVLFALDVLLMARASPCRLHRFALGVSAADFAWVAATAVVIASGALSTTGVTIAAVIAIGVLDFGLLQLWFRRRTGGGHGGAGEPRAASAGGA